jgi:hypothetical protein
MPTPEESSLDRYLESQAGLILSHASLRRGYVIMGVVGVVMLIVAAGVILGSIVSGQPEVAAGAIGPGVAGLVNLGLSHVFRRRAKPSMEVNANLTPEARGFLANLMKEVYGWPRAWGAVEPKLRWEAQGPPYQNKFDRQRERHAWRRMLASGSWGQRQHSAKESLTPEAFDVLNRASFQYNRVSGILGAGNADVARFSASIKGAADQAMADLFHVGFLLDKYPEGSEAAKVKGEQEITALTQLADKLEEMQKSSPAPVSQALSPSPVASVLEELRLDQLARSELNKVEEPARVDLRNS